jgi:hypothetical protein
MLTVPDRGAEDVAGAEPDVTGADAAGVPLLAGAGVAPPLQAVAAIATRAPSAAMRLPAEIVTCNLSSSAQVAAPSSRWRRAAPLSRGRGSFADGPNSSGRVICPRQPSTEAVNGHFLEG